MLDYQRISFGLLTPKGFHDFDNVVEVMKLWHTLSPDSFPDRWGAYEPLTRELTNKNIESLRDDWGIIAFFKRTKPPKLAASFTIREPFQESETFSLITATAEVWPSLAESIAEFISAACASTGAVFGYVHRVNQAEVELGQKTWTVSKGHFVGSKYHYLSIFSQHLEKGLPNLYWLTALGAPYIEAMGASTIDSCPAYKKTWLREDLVVIQLSKSIDDSLNDESNFEILRERVKTHLGLYLFQ